MDNVIAVNRAENTLRRVALPMTRMPAPGGN